MVCERGRTGKPALRIAIGRRVMYDHERAARLQTAPDFPKRPHPFAPVEKVQRKKTRRAIEGTKRRLIDRSGNQLDPVGVRRNDLPRKIQHGGRWIDACEPPARPRLRHGADLEPASSADHEHMSGPRRPFGEQKFRHPVKVRQARHLFRGFTGVGRDRGRIQEWRKIAGNRATPETTSTEPATVDIARSPHVSVTDTYNG